MKTVLMPPTMGQILRAWWPDHLDRAVPGPKLRPVFYLGQTRIADAAYWVVAYGTSQCSQEKECRNGGDLYVACSDNASMVLQSDTRFDFNQIQAIPASEEYFPVDRQSGKVRSVDLPASLFAVAVECMRYANVPGTLRKLGVVV